MGKVRQGGREAGRQGPGGTSQRVEGSKGPRVGRKTATTSSEIVRL